MQPLLLLVLPLLPPAAPPGDVPGFNPERVRIEANPNVRPAGTLRNGVLTLDLRVVRGQWHPEADDGPSLEVLAFQEVGVGGPPTIPGPMIRVPVGTRIRVTVSNTTGTDLTLLGLHERPAEERDPTPLPAGGRQLLEFTAGTVGTYFYLAVDAKDGFTPDVEMLAGALIVDPPGPVPNDRIFVIGIRFQPKDSSEARVIPEQETMVINGKSWPYTERLHLVQGDSVHWRILNASGAPHPMHLHGFYFRVDSRGSWLADTVFTWAQQRRAVTELMYAGSTFTMSFVPTEPGNWVFHCHFAFHVGPDVALKVPAANGDHGDAHTGTRHMSGLVLGMHVEPRGEPKPTSGPRREIRLFVNSKPKQYGEHPRFGFVIQKDGQEPAADSLTRPSDMLLLTANEPVAIKVINRLSEPTAIHWHGLEIESFPDGVPDWSGMPGNIFTTVPARDSFVAEFTPPRAGTFIYHSHLNEMNQIMSGMFGALLVLPPGETYDPEYDRVIIAGGNGPPPPFGQPDMGTLNGTNDPPTMRMVAGRTYRLRLININADWRVQFTLGADTAVAMWRPIAKDGDDLPEHQRVLRPAYLLTGPGETADFEFTPEGPGLLTLEARTRDAGWYVPMRIRVQPAKQ